MNVCMAWYLAAFLDICIVKGCISMSKRDPWNNSHGWHSVLCCQISILLVMPFRSRLRLTLNLHAGVVGLTGGPTIISVRHSESHSLPLQICCHYIRSRRPRGCDASQHFTRTVCDTVKMVNTDLMSPHKTRKMENTSGLFTKMDQFYFQHG